MNRMLLVLKRSPEQEAALETLLDNQQDKASPLYHQWLTPEEFGRRFGPNDRDMQIVTSWLEAHGFQIGKIAKGRNMIEFSGNAAQVQEALHTAIRKYVVNGEEHWANANDPEIPTALTPLVAGVHTLHNFIKKPMIHMVAQSIPAKLEPQGPGKPPMVTFPGTPPLHALGPSDYWKIYNVNPLFSASPVINGSTETIAVVGRSDLFAAGQDIDYFRDVFEVPLGNGAIANTINDGPDPGDLGGSEEAEATLDVSWSGALAPAASPYLVVSAVTNTTDGADLSELYIIDNNLGDVMTESFGGCEASSTSTAALGFATLAEQAAAQGITYLVATGDSGAEGCDDPGVETTASGPVSVNLLAATPFDVAVGGTIFNENGQDSKYWNSTNNANTSESALSYIPEDVWNESCTAAACGSDAGIFAGGGGASMFFPKPTWQSGVTGIPNDGHRDLPDVSLTAASHDPYLLCLEGSCVPDAQGLISFAAVAGTSAATPSFAGIMALVDQKMSGRQGQADYVLYKLAAAEKLSSCNASSTSTLPGSTCIFDDVTVGNNAVPLTNGTESTGYQAGVGYDPATGLGSVNVANLVNHWNSITFQPTTTTITSVSPTTITHGQAVNVDIAVTANSGTGTPSGSVALMTSSGEQTTGVGVFPLAANATANQAISFLPGGTYALTAKYSGDGTFAPSPLSANSPMITVSAESSKTALSALSLNQNFNFVPFSSGPYGSFVYLRADVAGQSGEGIPTGQLSFMDGANLIGFYFLNSAGNTETPNFLNSPNGATPTGLYTLAPGAHTITADYQGDYSFAPSVSSAVNLTITQAATSSAVSTAAAAHGSLLSATINSNSGGTPPSGTMTFFVNGTQVGTPVTVHGVPALTTETGKLQGAQATASYADSALNNGSYAVTGTYSGDSNYLTSTSSSTKLTQQSDFELSAGSKPAISIQSPGDSGSLTLTITVLDGYNGTINFTSSSCTGLPAGAKCTFKPPSVTGGGSTVLTVTTTAAAGQLMPPVRRPLWWVATTGVGIAGLFLVGGCSRRRFETVLALALYTFSITAIGCGGGSNGNGTTPTTPTPPPPTATAAGTSNVVVTATSGTLVHTVSFRLTVE
jgi:hypothetical protein